jgi:hypothetical protein
VKESIKWTGWPYNSTKGTAEWALPNFAGMVAEKLERGYAGPADIELDEAHVGRLVLRQLHEKRERRKGIEALRLSAAGACLRRLAYDFHGAEPDGFVADSSSVLAFGTGDATEALLVAALLGAIPKTPGILTLEKYGEKQQAVSVRVPLNPTSKLADALRVPWVGVPVYGHPDGFGRCPMWPKGEPVPRKEQPFVLEVKSMSDFGFKHFREAGMPPYDEDGKPNGYYWQTQAYQLAHRQAGVDVEWSYIIAFGKSVAAKDAVIADIPPGKNGKPLSRYIEEDPERWGRKSALHGVWVRRDEEVQQAILERFATIIHSSQPEDIAIPFGPDRYGRLNFPCDWCSYWRRCFPTAREVAAQYSFPQTQQKIQVRIPASPESPNPESTEE